MTMIEKSIEELENNVWENSPTSTGLIKECHRLRRIPIGQLSIENLRMMLGQKIGVKYLLPIALNELEKNPLAEGDLYPGDLLQVTIKLATDKTAINNKEQHNQLKAVVDSLTDIPVEIADYVYQFKTESTR